MSTIPDSIHRLIEEFSRFPGIGQKTAQRMVFHVLKSPNDHAVELAQAVMDMKTKIRFCSICNGITEEDPCRICTNPKRDQSSICIVEDAADIYTFEKTNAFQGLYHVLGGVLSPLDGIGPTVRIARIEQKRSCFHSTLFLSLERHNRGRNGKPSS